MYCPNSTDRSPHRAAGVEETNSLACASCCRLVVVEERGAAGRAALCDGHSMELSGGEYLRIQWHRL